MCTFFFACLYYIIFVGLLFNGIFFKVAGIIGISIEAGFNMRLAIIPRARVREMKFLFPSMWKSIFGL